MSIAEIERVFVALNSNYALRGQAWSFFWWQHPGRVGSWIAAWQLTSRIVKATFLGESSMAQSAELTRFLADHATAERRTAFLKDIKTAATMTADLAAVLNDKGYRINETEVAAALGSGNHGYLTDGELEGVVGGNSLPLLDMLRGNHLPDKPLAGAIEPPLQVLINLGYQ